MSASVADDVTLSPAEIRFLLHTARRGDARQAGQERSAAVTAMITGGLTTIGSLLWCANLLALIKG